MDNTKFAPRTLPPQIAGGKRAVHKALHDMAADQRQEHPAAAADEVYFRRAQLADRSGLSTSRVAVVLRWLEDQGFITYIPGDPGTLSQVTFLPEPPASSQPTRGGGRPHAPQDLAE